ncbi:hypothetical protein [Photorhabdus luminescens]|uniref:Uncharacterized protein n=1 Tax=Photorhabdus luminescens subsp. mexicana TaxID=2100167 RepID=A0A4R4IX19_PHOLU|nr:hypothetical protein [Photorhabdus luminescens]TDB45232.1 hypothetical protein C5468_21960 [Photorhabdus luminescens subsp. mexicana]
MLTCSMKDFNYTVPNAWHITNHYCGIELSNVDIIIYQSIFFGINHFDVVVFDRRNNEMKRIKVTRRNIKKMQKIIDDVENLYKAGLEFSVLLWDDYYDEYENN